MILSERLRGAVALASLVLFALSGAVNAEAQTAKVAAGYSAVTAGLTAGAGINIRIDILRWSTDDEAGKLVGAFKEKADKWSDTLDQAAAVGHLWASSSSLGYSIKLARQMPLPDGGTRIVLAVSPALGSWDRPVWKATGQATDYPFTIVELRVNKAGSGEGKASLSGRVMVDDTAPAVVLENYPAAPVLLKSVARR
jgi:hypothetical protein